MNIIDAISHHARMRPYEIAVVHPTGAANFQQLCAIVAQVAARLRSHGVEPGMRAAIYVTDPFLHLVLILAAMVNGTVSVSSHPNYDPIPSGAGLDAYLVDRELPFAPAGAVVLPVGIQWVTEGGRAAPAGMLASGFTDPGAVCRLFTSSGTTGVPKVVGHSGANLEAMATRGLALEPASQGPNLCMMWMSTIGGYGTAQATLWHGSTLVLASTPLMVLRFINLYRVAMLRTSPQQLQGLFELVRGHPVRFPSLQRIEVGGASTPTAVLLGARATMCPNVIGIYGSTEAALVAQATSSVMHAHPDAAGFAMPDVRLRIVDELGQPVGPGVEGLVQIRTPYMVSCYLGDDPATQAAFRESWFIPGDLGVMRADGLLQLRGRADEMINAGGVKLSPTVVDEFLLTQPGVRDAATFAYRQAGRADQIWAAVVCSDNFNEMAVLSACQARLNSRAPTRFIRLGEIPRNAMGKPLRQKLTQDALLL